MNLAVDITPKTKISAFQNNKTKQYGQKKFQWGPCFEHLFGRGCCYTYFSGLLAMSAGASLGYVITDSMIEAYKKADIRVVYACSVANILSFIITGVGIAIIGNRCHEAIRKGHLDEEIQR